MHRLPLKIFAIVGLVCGFLVTFAPSIQPVAAQDPRDDTIAVITSPTANSQVFGEVQIIGSVGHPTIFAGYELEFDNLVDANEVWIPIGQRVTQQINNGVLGIWDTADGRVSDGTYRIRLSVYLSDGSDPVTFVVDNVQLTNTAITPLPTVRTDVTDPTQLPAPGSEANATPLIEQPPTSTPRPDNAGGGANTQDTGDDDSDDSALSINFGQLQSSFCLGVYIALIGFVIFGGYLWLRARLRPTARQMWWQIRSEFDRDE
jgi:hypothetical protein